MTSPTPGNFLGPSRWWLFEAEANRRSLRRVSDDDRSPIGDVNLFINALNPQLTF
jgi:hypothetical protein